MAERQVSTENEVTEEKSQTITESTRSSLKQLLALPVGTDEKPKSAEKRVRFPPEEHLTDVRFISPRTEGVKWKALMDVGESPFQRCWHIAFGAQRGMYIFGGVFFNAQKQELFSFNDMHCFDWDTAKWRQVQQTGDQPKNGWAMNCAEAKEQGAWIIGGRDHDFNVQNILYFFDTDKECWNIISQDGPHICASGISRIRNNRLVTFGGIEMFSDKRSNSAVYSNKVFAFDIATKTWKEQQTKGKIPSPRGWHAQCKVDSTRLLIYGGTDSQSVLNDLYLLETKTWTWVKLETSGDIPPHIHSATFVKRKKEKEVALLHGGGVPYASDTADGIRAVMLENGPMPARARWALFRGNLGLAPVIFGHTAVVKESMVFYFGGQDSSGKYHKEIWKLDSLFGDPLPPTLPPSDPIPLPTKKPGSSDRKRVITPTRINRMPSQQTRTIAPTQEQLQPQTRKISTSHTSTPPETPKKPPPPLRELQGPVHDSEPVGSWKRSYEVIRKIGRGGFSTILLVKEVSSGLIFAAKRSHLSAASSEVRLKALREVKIHSCLVPHPFVVKFHEAFIAKGGMESVIVMENCSGGDLYSRIRDLSSKKQMFPVRHIAVWFTSIVMAVDHIHSLGYIHADLKSANVLFNEDGSARLGDFGMTDKPAAAHRRRAIHALHEVNGTPDYMAPEQLPPAFAPASFETDCWALGVLLYEMAALQLPFGGIGSGEMKLEEIAERITKRPYNPLPECCNDPNLLTLVSSLLPKNPALRLKTQQILTNQFCSQVIPELQSYPSCSGFVLQQKP